MQPAVAIVTDMREFDNEEWHCVPDQYMNALSNVARVLPLFLPALGDFIDFDKLLNRVDGVMLTGSKANVHPSNFGVQSEERYGPFDKSRDATSLPLIRTTLERGIPILAICRGMQELNVALGGTIQPNILDDPRKLDHRAPESLDRDTQFEITQEVNATKSGCVDRLLGTSFRTNSLHNQAIDRLAPCLEVEARALDGTIEAVSVKNAIRFAIGVQWHPEYWAESETISRRIFEAFGDAVRQYASEKN